MKKVLLALALVSGLSACGHTNAPRAGDIPAAEPALGVAVFGVAACYVLGVCS